MSHAVARRVAQKESRLLLASPLVWLLLTSFSASALFIVFSLESFFARNIADLRPLFQWLPLLLIFLCPALSMSMWSDERERGTVEYLLTQPVGISRFVFGKFRACLKLLVLALLSTLPPAITLSLIAELDWGPVATAYFAALLMGSAYLCIGLFVSSCTNRAVLSFIGSTALCALLYLLGHPLLGALFDSDTAAWLQAFSTASRFESFSRGVVDLCDLYYYLCLCGIFLSLNVYVLERGRWSKARSSRHRYWRSMTSLLIINLLLANVWLARLPELRFDLSQGQLYSLSPTTQQLLDSLDQRLLLRAYFSSQPHPQLAPLVPQLKDLLQEYAAHSKGKLQLEFIEPDKQQSLEQQAIDELGLRSASPQSYERQQSSWMNDYFHILLNYGSEHEVLKISDLIEVRSTSTALTELQLRKPEYQLSRAIRDALYHHQLGGDLFADIDQAVELVAYLSDQAQLPPLLQNYQQAITAQLDTLVKQSEGKFSVRLVDPGADGGATAQRLQQELDIQPLVTAIGNGAELYFYLTLEDEQQVVQLPTGSFDPDEFRATLEAGLRRFANSLTRSVALALPHDHERAAQQHSATPSFHQLERSIAQDYSLRREDLSDGSVDPRADILAVIAPQQLDSRALYAIDQFLMRGGTVILATSPYSSDHSTVDLRLKTWPSGLQEWLAHHGLQIGDSLVMDSQSSALPTRITRQIGGHEFRDVELIDYPYFIDVRPPQLNPEHPITADLAEVTMAWASPIEARPRQQQELSILLQSSEESWLSNAEEDIAPHLAQQRKAALDSQVKRQAEILGLALQGRFRSWFAQHPLPATGAKDSDGQAFADLAPPIEYSPQSARIILFASNDFLSDHLLNARKAATNSSHHTALELIRNSISWSLQDDSLLQIRPRAYFNRSLPAIDERAQALIEYINYGFAALYFLLLALAQWLLKRWRMRRYQRLLAL